MPVSRGKKIVDTRPQAVEVGVSSLPLRAAQPASTAPPSANQRGARRITSSGVEEIPIVRNTLLHAATSAATQSAPGSTPPPQHFTVPSAVLQRIQQQHRAQPPSSISSTAAVAEETPHSVPQAGVPHTSPTPATTISKAATSSPHHQHHQRSVSTHALAHPSSTERRTRVTSESVAASVASVAVEEVSEADIAATVAARKTISACHPDGTTTAPPPPLPLHLASQARGTAGKGGVDAAAADASAAPTASAPKPVIYSHRWRQQLFAKAGASHPSPPTALDRLARDRRGDGDSGSTDEDEEGDDNDDFASPFGGASVIKFNKTGEEGVHGFGGAQNSSSSSSSTESDDSGESASASEGSGDEAQQLGRRQRHALRQKALEARQKKRVQHHMSGFDKEFLRQQEAQLLVQPVGEEDEEDSSDSYLGNEGEEGEESGADEVSEAPEEGEEESLSKSASESHSDGDEERAGDGSSVVDAVCESESGPVDPPASSHSTEGFGAMNRARLQEAEERRARQLQRTPHPGSSMATAEESASAAPFSSSPLSQAPALSGLASSIGARSQWLDTFFFAVHESRLQKGGCHHTLVGLRGPVAIRGPCGLIGFGLGELCVNGFYLGKKQVNLWHEEHHAVLTPMRKLKTKHAQDMSLPQWTHVPDPAWPPGQRASLASTPASIAGESADAGKRAEALFGQPMNPCHYAVPSKQQQKQEQQNQQSPSANQAAAAVAGAVDNDVSQREEDDSEEDFLQSLQWNCEAVFGEIDWDWVESTVQSWRNLFSNKLPPILLVVQPSSSVVRPRGVAGPMRRFYLSRKRNRKGGKGGRGSSNNSPASPSGAYMDIPSFVAHRSETSVDLALLPTVVPSVAAQGCGCVMVLGSANIGKSTLCRFLANVLLSQHGLCYWLDLDVGQPEFGVPGQLSLVQVRRPLMRERDHGCVRTVASLFIGANTVVQCPVSAANALATICAQAAALARDHPVVVNTHGWVLQTGRRVSVEALRRLRPRQVIHLYKEREEAWAQDTAALLDPRNGLNAEVVQRRFLVRHSVASAVPNGGAAVSERSQPQRGKGQPAPPSASTSAPLGRLPFANAFDNAAAGVSSPSSPGSPASSPTSPKEKKNNNKGNANSSGAALTWRGQVHAVRVEREETFSTIQRLKATKGTRGRQQRWQTYFAPLLHFYAQRNSGKRTTRGAAAAEPETTLLEAPLTSLCSIVLAERDEKAGDVALRPSNGASSSSAAAQVAELQMHAEVAAALEHAVVAVLFHTPAMSGGDGGEAAGTVVVRSLASLPCGFPVSCYGVVESSEGELLNGKEAAETAEIGSGLRRVTEASATGEGWIRLRVPLRPSVVAAMLQGPCTSPTGRGSGAGKTERAAVTPVVATQISIAYSAALRQDTSFVDV